MGYFRRYKLSDYTADECRKHMKTREDALEKLTLKREDILVAMEQWACFRELLARHEKQNQSPLDQQ